MILASLISLKFFIDLSGVSEFFGSGIISAIDFSIWLVADKTKFLVEKPLAIKITFIYWIEMFAIIGLAVLAGFILSLFVS